MKFVHILKGVYFYLQPFNMKQKKPDMYSNKQRWKIFLLSLALLVIGGSLFLSNEMVATIANKEKSKAKQWGQTIQKKVELVRFTNATFDALRIRERQRIQMVVDAQKVLLNPSGLNMNQDIDFALKIINSNQDIPIILLDDRGKVSQFKNIVFDEDSSVLAANIDRRDSILEANAKDWKKQGRFFQLEVFEGFYMTYTYDESQGLKNQEAQRDSILEAFNHDLISDTRLMPVILVDAKKTKVLKSNLKVKEGELTGLLETFNQRNNPIRIDLGNGDVNWLYYDQSSEVKQLKWFPYIQFSMVAILVIVGYLVFSTFRRAEQNQVWAGMAKETAHQLGTPLSSLGAWVDLLESNGTDSESVLEMRKDLKRLEKVTDRFSKIGSEAKLEKVDITKTIGDILDYLRPRLSEKVSIKLIAKDPKIIVPHNAALIEWVIENITKNAVDAMGGKGDYSVSIHALSNWVHIDLKDSGKGLTPKQFKSVFQPGYSTKKRGWGLGLSLAKRIIEDYHKGKIFVLHSETDKGTTFRISLPL